MYKMRINRFWTLVVSSVVIVGLSFGVEAVLSQTLPTELKPEQGVEGPVGNIGVPVEVNGVIKELQVGDVVTTGNVTEVNKDELLIQVLNSLQIAGIVETSTIIGAIGQVLSLPDEICDFNGSSIGSSVASNLITNETSTETIRFSVAEGCKLKFEGKSSDFDDEAEQGDETSEGGPIGLGDTSWLVPIPIRAEAMTNPADNRYRDNDACTPLRDGKITSTKYLGDEQMLDDSQSYTEGTTTRGGLDNSRLKVATVGLVRLEDKSITVRIETDRNGIRTVTRNILDEDCGVFFAEAEVTYNNDGSASARSVEGTCSSWMNGRTGSGITPTYIWEVVKENGKYVCNNTKHSSGGETAGKFAINHENNLFLDSLREASYYETSTLLSSLKYESYTLTVQNSVENDNDGERVKYSCQIDKLPSFYINEMHFDKTKRLNENSEEPIYNTRVEVINGKKYIQIGHGDTIAHFKESSFGYWLASFLAPDIYDYLRNGELYVQIPEDDSTVNTYMECRAAFIKISESAGTSYTTAPVRSSPDTRTLESLDSYVTGFFPGITFSKSINVEVDDISRPLTYSVSRRVAIPQPARQVSVYNYRVPAYNYETRPVYNYGTRSVYNYETRPVYNYRTITTYTTRTRDVYNYRTRSVYNYEQIKTTCKRKVWFVCVSWNYRNGKRIAPFTERVRVAPFTETVRTPFTERWRVSPFTERVRVAPYTERVRVSPYTERVRVAPYTTTRSFTSPQYRSGYTRVAPYYRTETPAPRYEWRTMTVSSVIRSGSYPDRSVRALTYRKRTQQVSAIVDYNGNITSCTGVCRQHRSAISSAPTVATLNGVRDVTWSSTLASLRRVREYDRDNVIGNLNKSTVYEALSIVNGLSNRVRPFATGRNSLSLTTIKDKVQSANAVDLSSEPLLHNRRTRRYNEIRARF